MDLQYQDAEGVQLAEWLENVLKNYCVDLAKRKLQTTGDDKSSETSAFRNSFNTSTFSKVKDNIYLFITSIKFDKFKKDFDVASEDLLKVEITYYIGDRRVQRKENFVIHVSRTLENSETTIEKILETDKREIDFYTTVIPELEDWSLSKGVNLRFAVPTCFFGQYEVDKKPSMFKMEFNFNPPSDSDDDSLSQRSNKRETRTILIVHDLEKIKFQLVGESKIGIQETKAVLRELAEIHGVSWAYQHVSKKPLAEKWPFLLRPKDSVPVCVTLVEEGISSLLKCLNHMYPKSEATLDFTKRLKAVRPKLTGILYVLLTPPKTPAPSCLIHLDLQYRNIAFRQMGGEKLPENHKLNEEQIDCRITQWKLVSVGSPMHDVAFLFLTSLSPEDRRKHTKELVVFYYKAFRRTARHLGLRLPFKVDFFQHEFEKSLFLALLLIIGNFEVGMSPSDVPSNVLESILVAMEDVADSGFL